MSEWEPLEVLPEEGARRQPGHEQHDTDHASRNPVGLRNISQGGASTASGHSNSDSNGHGAVSSTSSGGGRTLTRELVLHAIAKSSGRLRVAPALDVSAEDKTLAKQTHLHLNGMRISRLDTGLKGLNKLETLYLYDNRLQGSEGLTGLPCLTHLYLNDNLLPSVSGLGALTGLQKLYLQGNSIQVVSGLESLLCLEELHISSQRLPPGQSLVFDPASLEAVAPTLRVLCASNCGLQEDTLLPVCVLGELRRLEVGSNRVTAIEPLEHLLRGLPRLMALDLKGNPVCKLQKYRETLIVMCTDGLSLLDGESVQPQQREFLLRLQIKKLKAAMAAEAGAGSHGSTPEPVAPGGMGVPAAGGMARALQGGVGRGRGRGSTPPHAPRVPRHAPPPTAGFGAPRHLQHQVNSARTTPSPFPGMAAPHSREGSSGDAEAAAAAAVGGGIDELARGMAGAAMTIGRSNSKNGR